MSHTLVIASRELRERKRIFLMAAALATIPFLATLLPAAKNDRPDVIAVVSGFLAVALALGVATAHGASTIAGDLAERRLSFYFAKPVSPASLWFGKTIAALVASFACASIIAVPAMLAIGNKWWGTWLGGPRLVGIFAIGVIVLYLISHALSTMVRSHSILVGIDFVLIAATLAGLYLILRPLWIGGGDGVAIMLAIGIGVAFLAILACAPVFQLAQGRTDIRRSHAALSRVVWISVAAVVLIVGVYVMWFLSVDPGDLREVMDVQQAGGNAVYVAGRAKGRGDYISSFILDPATGRHVSLESPAWNRIHFSSDGRSAAWLQSAGPIWRATEVEVYTRRLDDPDAKNVATGITANPNGVSLLVSDDGSRAAFMSNGKLTIYDLTQSQSRLLASFGGFEKTTGRKMYFVDNDTLRVLHTQRESLFFDLAEVNIPAKKLTKVAQVSVSNFYSLSVSRDGSRILIPREGALLDGRTGATIAKLPMTTNSSFNGTLLGDGSVAMVKKAGNAAHLYTFDPNGKPVHDVVLPVNVAWISGELGDHKLVLLGHTKMTDGANGKNRRMFVVDLQRGAIERTMTDIKGPMPQWGADPRLPRYRDGQPFAAVNAGGKLILWDSKTGAVKPFPSAR